MTDWIQTYTGKQFFLINPRPEDVDIYDIAHHLSQLCRFVGACTRFYSVAQHSIILSHRVPEEFALWGLMHDASEAYIGDLSSPVKKDMFLFKEMERKILRVIAGCFGLKWPVPQAIKEADLRMRATERRDVMRRTYWDWEIGAEPYEQFIMPIGSIQAEVSFLSRYNTIIGTRKQSCQHK